MNFKNEDSYKDHKHKTDSSEVEENGFWFSQYSLPFGPQTPSRAQCLPGVATVNSTSEAVLRTGSPLCKDIWASVIIKAQRNASPMVSPGIKTK